MTLAHPFRYFAQRGVSVLSVGLCAALVVCLFCANGILSTFFGLNSVTQRLILTAALYLVLAFTVRAAFNAAKYQESACTAEHREQLLPRGGGLFPRDGGQRDKRKERAGAS